MDIENLGVKRSGVQISPFRQKKGYRLGDLFFIGREFSRRACSASSETREDSVSWTKMKSPRSDTLNPAYLVGFFD